MTGRIVKAPHEEGAPILGRTLPSLLYDACARFPNPKAFNQPVGEGWRSYSFDDLRVRVEEIALGLSAFGLEQGDRVAFFMESDVHFCIADMGCLVAGVVNVPVYLTQAPDAIRFVMNHAETKALFVSNLDRLAVIAPVLAEAPTMTTIIVADSDEGGAMPALPERVGLLTMEAIRQVGRTRRKTDPEAITGLLDRISPQDLATIIYTSGTTGQPKGVMLSHENISSNALTAFSCLGGYRTGAGKEVVLSFLPLTHVFARTLYYGHIGNGSSIYFSTPNDLARDLARVRPTIFAAVPRVLEKLYARILERGASLTGVKSRLFGWSLGLARQFEMGRKGRPLFRLKRRVADGLVFDKWRAALGGRIRHIICGGAALNEDLANLFAAAGVDVIQGYGLTETSPVIACNRIGKNRAGTVGMPIPGSEVMIAEDGEVLARGPNIMKGYYRDEERTAEAIDGEGWFHTGDVGEFSDDGFLRITDRKKDLFKLSTGKYVMPQPLENQLSAEPLIEQAVVVGMGYKYATALIFPNEEALFRLVKGQGFEGEPNLANMVTLPEVVACFQALVDRANEGMDHWSTIKRFTLLPAQCTIDNGLLTPTLKVKRANVHKRFEKEINAMYESGGATVGVAGH